MAKAPNEALRDFQIFNAANPLPVGDPSSGVYNPTKKDLRDLFNDMTPPTAGDPNYQGVLTYGAVPTGNGSSYTLTGLSQVPVTGQTFFFTPNADSTVPAPAFSLTDQGGLVRTGVIVDADGRGLAAPLRQGTSYLLRYGEGVAQIVSRDAREARAAASGLPATDAAIPAHVDPLPIRSVFGSKQPLIVTGGATAYQVQPVFDQSSIQLQGPAGTLDCAEMIPGTEVLVYLRSGDRVIAKENYVGASGNIATATGVTAARVIRLSGATVFQMLAGPAPTYSIGKATHDVTIVWGGQSNAQQAHQYGGMGGFAWALRNWIQSPLTRSIRSVQAATGGSAMDRRSVDSGVTNYWWNTTNNTPGSALTTYMNAVAAAVADGAPAPEWCFWVQGESDVDGMALGRLTTTQLRDTIVRVWDHIRATYPNMKFIVGMIGSFEQRNIDIGASRVRNAYLAAIANVSYATQGPDLYDLPRMFNNLHYYETGYAILGARFARAWANLSEGQGNALGPRITAAGTQSNGRTLVLSMNAAAAAFIPRTPIVAGPTPYGIYVIDGLDGALVPADYAQITGSGQMTLFMPRSVRGMKVGGPWGWAPHVRQGQVLTDSERDLYHRMLGQPLGTFLIDIP